MGRKPCRIVQGWVQVPRALINLSVVVHICDHSAPVRVALISHTVRRNSCSSWTSWPWTYSRKMTRVPVPSLGHKEDHQLFSGSHIQCGTCAHTICSHLSAAIMTLSCFYTLSLCMRHIHPEKGRGKNTSPPVMFGLFVCIPIPVAGLPFHCSCISTWQRKLHALWKHSQFWPYSDWLKWCSLRNYVNQLKGLIVKHECYCNQPGSLLCVLRFILFLFLWWKKTKLNLFSALLSSVLRLRQ